MMSVLLGVPEVAWFLGTEVAVYGIVIGSCFWASCLGTQSLLRNFTSFQSGGLRGLHDRRDVSKSLLLIIPMSDLRCIVESHVQ